MTASPCSFSKKNGPIMPLDQNLHQTVTRSMYAWRFSVPQMQQFYLFTYPPRSKRKCIGWSISFKSWTNWTLYGDIPRSLCKIRLNDVSEMFKSGERRWIDVDGDSHTLSATAAIFSGVSTVLAFHALVYRWRCQFLSIFSQDNEHTELTMILFCQNQYAIFEYILQHYHDFLSNVAIFPSVVQAYQTGAKYYHSQNMH